VQARIPAALCAIHNFIREHDPSPDPHLSTTPDRRGNPEYDDNTNVQVYTGAARDNHAKRDEIAIAMWEDYQARRVEMGLDDEDGEEDSDEESDNDDKDNENDVEDDGGLGNSM
jgi:hypothetical protein